MNLTSCDNSTAQQKKDKSGKVEYVNLKIVMS